MGRRLFVDATLACPHCRQITEQPWAIFLWGHYSPYRAYQLGDHILWRRDEQDRPIPWAHFGDNYPNIGDPDLSPIWLPDPSEYGWIIKRCNHCGGPTYDGEASPER